MNHEFPIIDEVERLKNQKRYAEARILLEDAIAKYHNRYELYEELADVLIYDGDIEGALKALDFSETLEPETATSLYLRGYIALMQGDFVRAIALLEKSNTKNPNNPEVLRNLGWAYTMLGEVKKGVILLERALNIAPDDILIMEDLGVALLTQGKIQEAREYLQKVGKENHINDMGFIS